ncbi:MAG: 30S ribosomal protein S15 [Candidatus Diapherotrites archaeon]
MAESKEKEKKAEEKASDKKEETASEKAEKAPEKTAEKEKNSEKKDSAHKAKPKTGKKSSSQKPDWVEFGKKDIEEVVVNLANAGHTASEIGMMLRDQYGVPKTKQITGRTIEDILAEHSLLPDVPRDLLNLIRKSVVLQKHMADNHHDYTAKRGYILAVSKIRKLASYYISKGKLPKGWRYTPEEAALLVK